MQPPFFRVICQQIPSKQVFGICRFLGETSPYSSAWWLLFGWWNRHKMQIKHWGRRYVMTPVCSYPGLVSDFAWLDLLSWGWDVLPRSDRTAGAACWKRQLVAKGKEQPLGLARRSPEEHHASENANCLRQNHFVGKRWFWWISVAEKYWTKMFWKLFDLF